jgi:hypothetical protein
VVFLVEELLEGFVMTSPAITSLVTLNALMELEALTG